MDFFEIMRAVVDRFVTETRRVVGDNVQTRGTAILSSILVFLMGAGGIMIARGFGSPMVASAFSIISILGLMSIVVLFLLPGKQEEKRR
ncbi:MAG TPA: hypothetical protein ENI19_02745 [Candidatus Nealsonbacteria bacterium]|nr:hypothetical protein [Candidatus Nealsonbacteria bacterium]HEB46602.1 hypothetical protein [Candidatus Nealsonbacteria bacterium]